MITRRVFLKQFGGGLIAILMSSQVLELLGANGNEVVLKPLVPYELKYSGPFDGITFEASVKNVYDLLHVSPEQNGEFRFVENLDIGFVFSETEWLQFSVGRA